MKALVQEGSAEFLRQIGTERPSKQQPVNRLRAAFADQMSDCATGRRLIALIVASEEDASLKCWLEQMERNILPQLHEFLGRFGLHPTADGASLFHSSLVGIVLMRLGSDAKASSLRARKLALHAFDRLVSGVTPTAVTRARRRVKS